MRFIVTVTCVSSFEVDASSKEVAQELATHLIENYDDHVTEQIESNQFDWEVTDVEERE